MLLLTTDQQPVTRHYSQIEESDFLRGLKIFHVYKKYFSKNKRRRKATIVPLQPGVTIGQRDMLSKTDCMKLNSQYSCFPANNMDGVRKIQIICGMVGV